MHHESQRRSGEDEPQAFVKWGQMPKVLEQAIGNGVRCTLYVSCSAAGLLVLLLRRRHHRLTALSLTRLTPFVSSRAGFSRVTGPCCPRPATRGART